MLSFLDDYPHAKNLRYQLISSRDTDGQRILQSDWLIAFWAVTEEPVFPPGFRRIIKNIVMHQF